MNPVQVLELISQGESSLLEFKEEQVRPESLAREMVAFANTFGGTILIGVADNGTITGVNDVSAIEQRAINVARHSVIPSSASGVQGTMTTSPSSR